MEDRSIIINCALIFTIVTIGIVAIVMSNAIQGTNRISACVESGNVWTNAGIPGGYVAMVCVPSTITWSSSTDPA